MPSLWRLTMFSMMSGRRGPRAPDANPRIADRNRVTENEMVFQVSYMILAMISVLSQGGMYPNLPSTVVSSVHAMSHMNFMTTVSRVERL